MELNKYIDHTKLGAVVTKAEIDKLISEAIEYKFMSVCISPFWVKYAKERLDGTGVLVCTVIGFPHGNSTPEVKEFETLNAIKNGADEIDMVINVVALKESIGNITFDEISKVVNASYGKTVKVILETCYLTKDEIRRASNIAMKAGAKFVKTSTGFGTEGATLENLRIMLDEVAGKGFVKASGGVKTYDQALAYVELGVARIGSSSSVDIVKKINKNNKGEDYDTNSTY